MKKLNEIKIYLQKIKKNAENKMSVKEIIEELDIVIHSLDEKEIITVDLTRKELEFLTSLLNDVPYTYSRNEKDGFTFFQDELDRDEFSLLTSKFEEKAN